MTSIKRLWYGSNFIVFSFQQREFETKIAFFDRFKNGSGSGMSVALVAFSKSIKIHYEYDARPLIKPCNCY